MEDNKSPSSTAKRAPFWKRKRFLFAGAVVVMAAGILIYLGMSQFATYYVAVGDFVQESDSYADRQVRLAGNVQPDSVSRDQVNFMLYFTLEDDTGSIPVAYKGVAPDTFKEDVEVVVEGKLSDDGIFNATKLLTKCPSKYEAESTSAAEGQANG